MRETQKSEMANWVPMTVVREVKDGKIHEVCVMVITKSTDSSLVKE